MNTLKNVLFAFAAFISINASIAQSVYVEDVNGNDITFGTYTITGSDPNLVYTAAASVTNTAATSKEISVRRNETAIIGGSCSYFCWISTCYGCVDAGDFAWYPNTADTYANGGTPLPAGHTVLADTIGFYVVYKPQGNCGLSSYRYYLQDRNNPSDSVWVDFVFDICANGIEEETKVIGQLGNVYPNPSSSFAQVTYLIEDPSLNGSIEVYDNVGRLMQQIALSGNEGTAKIDLTNLSSGVYFYSLLAEGNKVATRKLIVAK